MKHIVKISIFSTFLMELIAFLFGMSGCQNGKSEEIKKEISTIIYNQQDAWNSGDIDGFMDAYWNNDSLLFISGDRVGYGWQKTLDNYKMKYPTQEIMGTLTFQIIQMEVLSSDACFVVGSWDLERPSAPIGGKFTLLWKKLNGKWVIVSDHTS